MAIKLNQGMVQDLDNIFMLLECTRFPKPW